jgi:hypothetical protein
VPATLVPVVVMMVTSGTTLVIATAAPTALGDSILFMEFLDYPTIISIMGVLLVEDAVAALLMIRLRRKGSSLLTLGVFCLRLWGRRLRQVVHKEPPFLGLGASIDDLEELNNGGQLIIHGQFFLHLDVGDTSGECGDNLLAGDPWDLVPHLAKGLDVLVKHFTLVLTHRLKIVLHGGALVRGHEFSDGLPAQILPRGNRLVWKVHEPSSRHILEGHGKPIVHHMLISTRGLNGNDVELEELDGVGGPIITRTDVRPELVRPDHVALLASESEAPGVLDELPSDLDVLASFADVVESAIMTFSVVLEGDACVFWSALDDLAAGLSTQQRCRAGNCLLGLSGFTIFGARGAMPCRRIWLPRTLGSSQGRVFVGDGDELGDSSAPHLTPVRSGLIAQQLLHHGESLQESTDSQNECEK